MARISYSFGRRSICGSDGNIFRIAVVIFENQEDFYVFNWVNYASYLTILNQKDKAGNLIFGTPNNAFAARQVQIGARITF